MLLFLVLTGFMVDWFLCDLLLNIQSFLFGGLKSSVLLDCSVYVFLILASVVIFDIFNLLSKFAC
jgi:hypothetical protein